MPLRTWQRIAWAYHILFAIGVIWPVQALVNNPEISVLGLPVQMAWAAGWVLGSLVVLWRLDSARSREAGARKPGPGGPIPGAGTGSAAVE